MKIILIVTIFLLFNALAFGSTIKASSFGFSEINATPAMQSALNSTADTVIIDNVGTWNVDPIFILRDNLTVIFEKGVIVQANKGFSTTSCLINITPTISNPTIRKNIILSGYGAVLKMRKSEYNEIQDKESRHCVSILNCYNIKLQGLTLQDSGGDGILISDSKINFNIPTPYSEKIEVRDCICNNNKRQGISVISARDLLIENCILENTSGTPPSAGIDFEPDFYYEQITNCVMRNCFINGNGGAGIQIYLPRNDATVQASSINIEKCVITNNKGIGLFIYGANKINDKKYVTLSDCIIDNNLKGIEFSGNSSGRVTIANSFFKSRPSANEAAMIIFDKDYNETEIKGAQTFGGFELLNCTISLNKGQLLKEYIKPYANKFEKEDQIRGFVTVSGEYGSVEAAIASEKDFKVISAVSSQEILKVKQVLVNKAGNKLKILFSGTLLIPANLRVRFSLSGDQYAEFPIALSEIKTGYAFSLSILRAINKPYKFSIIFGDTVLYHS